MNRVDVEPDFEGRFMAGCIVGLAFISIFLGQGIYLLCKNPNTPAIVETGVFSALFLVFLPLTCFAIKWKIISNRDRL